MSGYIPNPDDATQPTDAVIAETAQAEFRAIKAKLNNVAGGAAQGSGLQNILLNGSFQLNQEFGVTSIATPTTPFVNPKYVTDMWNIFTNTAIPAGVVRVTTIDSTVPGYNPPPNYATYQNFTITTPVPALAASDFYEFCQYVEGINMRHMGFGSVNARNSTILFYCRSSVPNMILAGTLRNGASTRSFVFNFTTGASNVWQRYAIPVPGDTVGGIAAWPTTPVEGAQITFTLGTGTTFKTATHNAWQAGNFIGTTVPNSANFMSNIVASSLEFTGVEWRPGSYTNANPIEIIPFQLDFALATRYYFQDNVFLPGTNAVLSSSFPSLMRKLPLFTSSLPAAVLAGVSLTSASIRNTGPDSGATIKFDARLEVT